MLHLLVCETIGGRATSAKKKKSEATKMQKRYNTGTKKRCRYYKQYLRHVQQ